MGGLFSSLQQQQTETHSATSGQSTSHRPYSSQSKAQSSYEDQKYAAYPQYFEARRQQLLEEEKKRQAIQREKERCVVPISSTPLHRAILQQPLAANWSPLPSNSAFIKIDVTQFTQEYNTVKHLFKNTNKKRFNVVQIERIQNPYLLGCYLLKKSEMECILGGYVEERRLFHGTRQSNVHDICENNFDWRLHGDSTGNRYGKGVSFSPISHYASYYSDKNAAVKVMFLVRVLISNTTVGHGDMTIPPLISPGYDQSALRYDTAQKENGHVIVKFSDNEYYPEYLIHYTVSGVQQNRKYYDTNFDYY
ncbi:poly [ADP-ribose] polymerase 12-like [Zootermopsis nevadensis]|uniref:poly [ADP-ribose] polymerase 12-like n=1 Tax=Zootermopsis nevadensis TaxID=136037 RepID=UPI000B8E87B0|nr:poly [ADP-ribose] polymerase 12-like [Zootermopsis nevadensis]